MDLKLKDCRALVTGASRGLGYAIALGLAQEGCRLAINSRNAEKLTAAAQALGVATGSPAFPLPGDVTDPALPEKLIRQCAQALGGLDLLVTNAGGPPPG